MRQISLGGLLEQKAPVRQSWDNAGDTQAEQAGPTFAKPFSQFGEGDDRALVDLAISTDERLRRLTWRRRVRVQLGDGAPERLGY